MSAYGGSGRSQLSGQAPTIDEFDRLALNRGGKQRMDHGVRALRWATASWAFMGLVGIPAFVFLDPFGGWRWTPYNAIYDQMMVSIYVAVGVCALRAIPRPLEHTSFLWFVVWSSLLHGGVMLVQAIAHPVHSGHLAGDVWILAGGLGLAIALRRARQIGTTPTSG